MEGSLKASERCSNHMRLAAVDLMHISRTDSFGIGVWYTML